MQVDVDVWCGQHTEDIPMTKLVGGQHTDTGDDAVCVEVYEYWICPACGVKCRLRTLMTRDE
jgi:hypothetical protein